MKTTFPEKPELMLSIQHIVDAIPRTAVYYSFMKPKEGFIYFKHPELYPRFIKNYIRRM